MEPLIIKLGGVLLDNEKALTRFLQHYKNIALVIVVH